jgi:hypothetical protein
MNDGEQDELDHRGSVERQTLNADVSEGDETAVFVLLELALRQ